MNKQCIIMSNASCQLQFHSLLWPFHHIQFNNLDMFTICLCQKYPNVIPVSLWAESVVFVNTIGASLSFENWQPIRVSDN